MFPIHPFSMVCLTLTYRIVLHPNLSIWNLSISCTFQWNCGCHLFYYKSIKLSSYFHHFRKNSVPPCPAGIYLLKFNNRNTRTRCEICSKLTIKTPERQHISHHISNIAADVTYVSNTKLVMWCLKRACVACSDQNKTAFKYVT